MSNENKVVLPEPDFYVRPSIAAYELPWQVCNGSASAEPVYLAATVRALLATGGQAQAVQPITGPCGQCKSSIQPCDCEISTILKDRGLVAVDATHYSKVSAQAKAAAPQAQANSVIDFPHEEVDALAITRYKVVAADKSMFWESAVVAGDGTRQLYTGRKVECENMARKFAGAFAEGAFVFHAMHAPQAQAGARDTGTSQFLMEADQHLLHRFIETTEDDESYDLNKEDMKRLAELGVVSNHGFGRYSVSMFGYWAHEQFWHQNPSLPLKTNADRDREHRAAIAAAKGKQ